MSVDPNELETHKIAASVHKWSISKDIIFLILKLGTVLGCIYIIMHHLVLLADKNPEAIGSIALVVQNLQLNQIVLYLVTASSLAYGTFERKGKKRAIAKMAQYQYQLEKNDPFRGSSNLTTQGDTPKGKKTKGARK